ncbi:Uncharacterized conserved protein [Rugamonas rubra]|uniref:Uncharacterized conserved protein n=1 Tax=Rugamonas rubra TaxID=758825 RepID=A0A1I4IKP3_9BURK|nr:DUF2164 domain-containing protein [Rugamonas rubra]SFL54864.1 Uncharacterized conserved protein [Rugamonas rubra]
MKSRKTQKKPIASLQGYFDENLAEKIGNVTAGALLGFSIDEIGPLVYNAAVTDVQENLERKALELDLEIHKDEFQYWRVREGRR